MTVGESPAALAARMVRGETEGILPSSGEGRRALAWALKDACYAVWSSAPAEAVRAAAALQAVCHRAAAEGHAADAEVEALAAWTAGISSMTQGEMGEAVRCFERAEALFASRGAALHAAQTRVPRIAALSMLGRHREASDCADVAKQALRVHGDFVAAGKVCLNLGSVSLRRGAYDAAASEYRQAAVLFARAGDHQHSIMADIGLADALAGVGSLDEALRTYARAGMRAATHRLPVLEALVVESVALVHLVRGRFREALAGLEDSRRRYERLDMPQHVAVAEKQLGDAYLDVRLVPEAIALFEAAIARFGALAMADEEAWSRLQLGRAQALAGRADEAAQSFATAGDLFAASAHEVGRASVALARAELALLGGDPELAVTLFRDAIGRFEAEGIADGRLRAAAGCGDALAAMGRHDEAMALLATTLAEAHRLALLPVEIRCLTAIGTASVGAGNDGAAAASYDAAIEHIEALRRVLPGDEIRAAFQSDHLRPYHALLRLALATHERAPDRESAAAVLRRLDAYRASVLADRLSSGTRNAGSDATTALRARLNWLSRRQRHLQEEGAHSPELADELRRTESALLEAARRDRLASFDAGVRPDETPLAIDRLQSAMGDDGAMVEYGVADGELFACVVTRDGVDVVRHVAPWPAVQAGVRRLHLQLGTMRHGAAVARHVPLMTRRVVAHLQHLHGLVWEPLSIALRDRRKVMIVPHGELGALPFAALHDGSRHLAQWIHPAVVPSARIALRSLTLDPPTAQRALVLAESSRLPHAAIEAARVGAIFPGSVVLLDDAATIDGLRRQAGDADVIHIACHAQFRGDNPSFSALHLHDGVLTAELAESLALRAGLVVLSACETGISPHERGDEMTGLVAAFLAARASRVVASLWTVDDETTEQFMSLFYGALQAGDPPSSALRGAQLQLLAEKPHPFHWAPFVIHGGW